MGLRQQRGKRCRRGGSFLILRARKGGREGGREGRRGQKTSIRHRIPVLECYPEAKFSLPSFSTPSLPPSPHPPVQARGITPRILQHQGQERVNDKGLHHVAYLGKEREGGDEGGREGRRGETCLRGEIDLSASCW